jgi:hypothetical protein
MHELTLARPDAYMLAEGGCSQQGEGAEIHEERTVVGRASHGGNAAPEHHPRDAYHNPKSGNAIVCPKGSLQNAAGTTCTDRRTGKWVKPARKHTVNQRGYPCPEGWKLKKSGNGCKKLPAGEFR